MKKCQIQKNTFLSPKCRYKKSYDDFKFFPLDYKGKLFFFAIPRKNLNFFGIAKENKI